MRASTTSLTTSQPSAQGSVVSSGTPVKVRAPRVKSLALIRTTLTMMRKPSVATETKWPDSRISGAPTNSASSRADESGGEGGRQEGQAPMRRAMPADAAGRRPSR